MGLLPKESTALFSSDASGTYSWPHTPPSLQNLDQSYTPCLGVCLDGWKMDVLRVGDLRE